MRGGESWRPWSRPAARQGAAVGSMAHGRGAHPAVHERGKWRSIPAELGPRWKAAWIFIRRARLGVWDRLLAMAQERDVELGMAFLGGTSIRGRAKEAEASKEGKPAHALEQVRRLGAFVAAMAPRLAISQTAQVTPSLSVSRQGRRTSCRTPCPCSIARRAGLSPTGAGPAMPSVSASGAGMRAPPSLPSATNRRKLARTGPAPTATGSNASGAGSRSGARSRPATGESPAPSWASSAWQPAWTGPDADGPQARSRLGDRVLFVPATLRRP